MLLEICGPIGGNVKLLERLVEGRKKLMSDVSLLDDALSRIHAQAQYVDETVLAAATSLQVKSWVYLRDTRRHSIFVEPGGDTCLRCRWHDKSHQRVGRRRRRAGRDGIAAIQGVRRLRRTYILVGVDRTLVLEELQ
jgi:hypothetical protein